MAVALASCCLVSGCKTSKDAAEAAKQMSETAKALCDYYGAVRVIFEQMDELYELNHELYAKPYTAEAQKKLKDNEAELAKRAALASELSDLAGSFSNLTGSTGSKDAAASAGKLEAEVDGLASVTSSSTEQAVVKGAMQALVTAIQEHKEREAAKAMDDAVKGLRDLFDKEEDVWLARELLYTGVASNLADALVDAHATDNMPLLRIGLDPFGLAPATGASDMNAKLEPAAKYQIEMRKADIDSAFGKATSDMSKSLHTMADRVHAVAEDKPIDFHSTPITVAAVKEWASQFLTK